MLERRSSSRSASRGSIPASAFSFSPRAHARASAIDWVGKGAAKQRGDHLRAGNLPTVVPPPFAATQHFDREAWRLSIKQRSILQFIDKCRCKRNFLCHNRLRRLPAQDKIMTEILAE